MIRRVRVLRHPAVRFLALGAALRAAVAISAPTVADPPVVEVSAVRLAEARAELERALGGPLAAADERAVLDRTVDEEILFGEALARGLERDNRFVRDRLVRHVRLVDESPGADDDALWRTALRLGLERSDLVVRRHLVATMRVLAAAGRGAAEPTDAELRRILDRDADAFRLPAAATVTHVFVRAARPDAEATARAILDRLRAGEPPDAVGGDAFALGSRLERWSVRDLGTTFGARFAEAADRGPEDAWQGPVPSAWGLHLVRVESRVAGRMPSFESVRATLAATWRREADERAVAEWLRERRERARVRIVGDASPRVDVASVAPVPRAAAFGD